MSGNGEITAVLTLTGSGASAPRSGTGAITIGPDLTSAGLITGSSGSIEVFAELTGGQFPANDNLADAIVLNPAGGTATHDLRGATTEAGEPQTEFGATVWYTLTPTAPATATFTVDQAGMYWAVYDEPTFTDMIAAGPIADYTNTSWIAGANTTYYIQVYWDSSSPPAAGLAAVPLTWTVTERLPVFTLILPTPEVAQTPATLRASITNGTPDGTVEFTLDGTPTVIYSVTLDDTGVLPDIAVPLPALTAASHTLTARDVTRNVSVTATFTVTTAPLEAPGAHAADASPDPVPEFVVQRWIIQDPAAGSYTFPANPAEMSNPHPARVLSVDTTIATDGQAITYEGAPKAHQWEFRGFTTDQGFLATLAGYAASNRRYHLIDHRRRAWTVTFEQFDAEAQIRVGKPWAHTYSMRCLIHSGPVQL